MRDGPSTRDDNGRRRYEVRWRGASVDGCLRQLATGRNGAGAGIDNDPGDGLDDSLFVHSSQVQLSERPCLHALGNVRMRMRENGMLLISSGQRRGEVLTEEFWNNCFVVRTKCQRARKGSRRDKATKPPASHGEECPGERCQQHTPAAALPPSPGVSSPAFSPRGHFIMVPIANSDVEDNTWGLRAGRAIPRTPTPATWQHEAGQSSAVVVFGLAWFQGIFCLRSRPPQHVPNEMQNVGRPMDSLQSRLKSGEADSPT